MQSVMVDHPPIGSSADRSNRVLMLAVSLVTVALLDSIALSQSVWTVEGNVYFRNANANARQLTSLNRDDGAVLAPKGRRIAFVRTVPGPKIWTALDDVDPQEIHIIDIDGTHERRLVSSLRYADHASDRAGLGDLRFSPDGRALYFTSQCAAVSRCVHKVGLDSYKTRLLGGCNGYEIIPCGKYTGYLLVVQHMYHEGGGSYEEVWLMSPDGHLVRDVGPGDGEEQFKETAEQFRTSYGCKSSTEPNHRVQPTRRKDARG